MGPSLGADTPSANEIQVSLIATSESLGPEEISRDLELIPIRSWRAGDTRANTRIVETDNGCVFASSPSGSSTPVHEQLANLLDLLENRREALQSLAADAYLEISVVAYANQYMPELHFGRALLGRLASIPVELDLDLYYLVEAEDEDGLSR